MESERSNTLVVKRKRKKKRLPAKLETKKYHIKGYKVSGSQHSKEAHNRRYTWYKLGLPHRHSAKAPEKPSVPLINCRTMSRY